jgi:hypothetical protein
MRGLVLYSVLAIVAFVLAASAAFVIKVLFIPGFEAWALVLPITGVLFIPSCALLIWLARKLRGGRDSGHPGVARDQGGPPTEAASYKGEAMKPAHEILFVISFMVLLVAAYYAGRHFGLPFAIERSAN